MVGVASDVGKFNESGLNDVITCTEAARDGSLAPGSEAEEVSELQKRTGRQAYLQAIRRVRAEAQARLRQ